MVYSQREATRREIDRWADETTETDSYILAYQAPLGAENALDEDDTADAEHREFLTIWEKPAEDTQSAAEQPSTHNGVLTQVYGASGAKPEYKERFESMETDADVTSTHSI